MKKTMLLGALLTIINTQVQAEISNQTTQVQGSNTNINTPTPGTNTNNNPATVTNQAAPQAAPAAQTPQAPQSPTVAPAAPTTQTPANNTQAIPGPKSETQAPPATMPEVMNCEYKIPAETKQIDQTIVIAWAEKAIVQAFDFESNSIDAQMQKLQNCFTDQGWQGFNNALQKSGNIEAIKTQKLTVSSQLDGKLLVTEAKDNQWKITAPLQVVYQNDKEKVTQLLNLNVTIGRKVSGDLGIVQMIASPRTATAQNNQPQAAATPSTPAATTQATQPAQPSQPAAPTNTPEQNPTSGSTNPGNVQHLIQ